MIRILIVDDSASVRRRFRMLLEGQPDLRVVGDACDGQEAVDCARDLAPDVVLMDVRMPKQDGLAAIHQIRELGFPIRVLVVSLYASELIVAAAFKQGAAGYLLKQHSVAELVPAIREVSAGRHYFSPALKDVSSQT